MGRGGPAMAVGRGPDQEPGTGGGAMGLRQGWLTGLWRRPMESTHSRDLRRKEGEAGGEEGQGGRGENGGCSPCLTAYMLDGEAVVVPGVGVATARGGGARGREARVIIPNSKESL